MSVVTPFPKGNGQAAFDRSEFMKLIDLYGRMVAAGHWKDYALRFDRDVATFAAFRRAAEHPEIRIEKRPKLAQRQGAFALIAEHGQTLKRGHELHQVLAPLERRLMRLVRD
ncbi:DUF2794 domain-containing protein [Sphingomicrobium marinum]|uniref:DUF2794 domain-containing protein n=1 Tax=Sphingomicrobium marinum TaxID=1227950 RepID=UPI00223F66F0|nr:DUF2794 domain-containing protein [Sphingomicrobium marinum]